MAGAVMGTPQFMAPEQAEGKVEEIDARSDIFSLGAILYNMLTLHPPVTGESVQEILRKIRAGEIAHPSAYNPKSSKSGGSKAKVGGATMPRPPLFPLRHCPGNRVPESLSAVCMKALALKQEDRYQSVPELQKDIEAYQGGFATSAEHAGTFKLLWLLIKRHKVEFIVSHSALLILILAGTVFVLKVTSERNRAEKALTDLSKTAPTFYSEALSLIMTHDFEAAMQKASYALSLQPAVPEYHRLHGDISQSLLRFDVARNSYAAALRLDKRNARVQESLTLTEKLLRTNAGRAQPLPASLEELHSLMVRQGRVHEAAALTVRLGSDNSQLEATVRAWLKRMGVEDRQRLFWSEGLHGYILHLEKTAVTDLSALKGLPLVELELAGTTVSDLGPLRGMPLLRLGLTKTRVSDLSPLEGMRLKELRLNGTEVDDLRPVKGMPLETLLISGTRVAELVQLEGMPLTRLELHAAPVKDLSPLRGMMLTHLAVGMTKVTDLQPLRGMPLRTFAASGTRISDLSALRDMWLNDLNLGATDVEDLSPLQGMPLKELWLSAAKVFDLTPLKGMPLERLDLRKTPVADISPLRRMPLKELLLDECSRITDLRPLAACPQLELLTIPSQCRDIEFLRDLSDLRRLSYEFTGGDWKKVSTAADFWKEYDAKKRKEGGG